MITLQKSIAAFRKSCRQGWNQKLMSWKFGLGMSAALSCAGFSSSALAAQLDDGQMKIVTNTAASVCNTVLAVKGRKTNTQIQGDVELSLEGLFGKMIAGVGGRSGRGSLNSEEFEGLSRDATAAALQGDRGCRERVFDKMFLAIISTTANLLPSPGDNVENQQPTPSSIMQIATSTVCPFPPNTSSAIIRAGAWELAKKSKPDYAAVMACFLKLREQNVCGGAWGLGVVWAFPPYMAKGLSQEACRYLREDPENGRCPPKGDIETRWLKTKRECLPFTESRIE